MRSLTHAFLLAFCLACRPGINYADPVSPRYAGSARVVNTPSDGDTLRIVAFNIEYARETRRAALLLSTVARLRDADIILLQEMTAPATRFLADSLHMRYVLILDGKAESRSYRGFSTMPRRIRSRSSVAT